MPLVLAAARVLPTIGARAGAGLAGRAGAAPGGAIMSAASRAGAHLGNRALSSVQHAAQKQEQERQGNR